MPDQNTTENVFRFLQLRPAAAVPVDDDQPPLLRLASSTPLARELAAGAPAARSRSAAAFLRTNPPERLLDSPAAKRVRSALAKTRASNGTIGELRRAAASNRQDLAALRTKLSDTLLAAKFAPRGPESSRVAEVFRAVSLLTDAGMPADTPLGTGLRQPLALPGTLRSAPVAEAPARTKTAGAAEAPRADLSRISSTLAELAALAHSPAVRVPAGRTRPSDTLFALLPEGKKRLTPAARALLDDLGLDVERQPIDRIAAAIEAERARTVAAFKRPGRVFFAPTDPPETLPYIRDVGVADLLVVKQHLIGYERMDIAHVENVMAGEKRSRNHRSLERTEETITIERETTTEKETELETAERFELNRESARTAKRDQEFGFGLSLSGKYGPSVEFSSTLSASTSSSTEESTKSAMRYAKDIMERSLERVVERVRTEQVRRVIREQEETNLHDFENKTNDHITGVYQFLEKVYSSQVFNYGLRQMFDFMVPEPASFLWHVEKTDTKLSLPPPPIALETLAPTFEEVNETNYPDLAARMGADGIEPPPPLFLTVATAVAHGQEGGDDSEEGQPRGVVEKELTLPSGYRPFRAIVRALALTDDSLTLAVTMGNWTEIWTPSGNQLKGVGSGHTLGSAQLDLPLLGVATYDPQSRVPLHILAFETNSFSLSIEMICLRDDTALTAWKIKTYAKLQAAYAEVVQRYEAKVADLKAQAEADAARVNARFGAPPSQNSKIIKGELKKHCISIVTRQRYEAVSAVQDGEPPFFPFPLAAEQGAFTRFFEQAFEWDQMQYVFYPYFWARYETWASRFTRDEVDPLFLEFLQAGAARVVVPVRPGFEIAVTHYLETKEIWNGEGEPPEIHDDLYVPIVREIQERTGAPQSEVPVGEPWITRVPTPLVILRSEDELPKWIRVDPVGWEWEEDES